MYFSPLSCYSHKTALHVELLSLQLAQSERAAAKLRTLVLMNLSERCGVDNVATNSTFTRGKTERAALSELCRAYR